MTSETESWPAIAPYVPAGSRTTAHVYDLVGRETTLTPPAGPATTRTFDAAGNETQTVVGNVTTTRVFDGLGRATSETVGTAPDAVVTTRTYDGQGRELTATTAGSTTKEVYDLAGRLTTVIEDFGGLDLTTAHGYDPLGREVKIIDPAGTASRTGYDRLGRACRTVEASTQGDAAWAALANVCTSALPDPSTATTHDAAGNAVAVLGTDARMSAALVDPLDRVITSITNCTNSGTTVPAIGTMCAGSGTQNATTNITSRTWYDAAGTIVATQDPADTADRTIVNVRGLVKETIANCTDDGTTPPSTASPPACVGDPTPPAGTNIRSTMTYDGTGATVLTIVAVGTGDAASTQTAYDGAGRVQAVKDPLGTITRSLYDPTVGELATSVVNCTTSGTTIPADWVNCTGAGTKDGTWNLTTTYGYDAAGNQVSVVAPNGRETRTSYDAGGRVETRTDNYVDGVPGATDDLVTTSFYDDAGRTAALRAPTANGTTFAVTRYLYDADGRLATEIRNCTDTGTTPPADPGACTGTGTQDRVTNLVTTYGYDARGNRSRVTAPAPSAAADTVATVTTRYAFDADNRLCRVVASSTQTDAQWDALADRCSTAIGGTTTTNVSTRYTYDGAGNLATMIDANGNTTTYGYDASGRQTSVTDALGRTVTTGYDALGRRRVRPTGSAPSSPGRTTPPHGSPPAPRAGSPRRPRTTTTGTGSPPRPRASRSRRSTTASPVPPT